uniref:Uncharacterized protein n=1 Tax=Ixodes ricinus TaxID=34613 RepID=A0A6B0UMG9_IXORI
MRGTFPLFTMGEAFFLCFTNLSGVLSAAFAPPFLGGSVVSSTSLPWFSSTAVSSVSSSGRWPSIFAFFFVFLHFGIGVSTSLFSSASFSSSPPSAWACFLFVFFRFFRFSSMSVPITPP